MYAYLWLMIKLFLSNHDMLVLFSEYIIINQFFLISNHKNSNAIHRFH